MKFEQPHIQPMTGKEIATMFGETAIADMEEQHTALGVELDQAAQRMTTETNPEELDRLRNSIFELREQMRELDRTIRKEQRRYGEMRGPVSF